MAGYRSFLFPDASIFQDSLQLDGRESHHLIKVLRAKAGDVIEVLNGRGTIYLGRIKEANSKAVIVQIEDQVESSPSFPQVTLLQSITKGKTMDLVVRMGTEIGAACIQPIFTHHGEVQIKANRLSSKVDKWEVTMIEACKQCGLPFLPQLGAPCSLEDWIRDNANRDEQLRIVASLEEGSRPLGQVLRNWECIEEICVAVGPEGDFSPAEYRALGENGFRSVRLAANILRAETAAAYILSVVDQHHRSLS